MRRRLQATKVRTPVDSLDKAAKEEVGLKRKVLEVARAAEATWKSLQDVPTTSPDFLRADVRRQQRPYLLAFLCIVQLGKLYQEVFPLVSLQEQIYATMLACTMMGVAFLARGRPDSLNVDALTVISMYANYYLTSWYLNTKELSVESVGESIMSFVGYMQLIVAMGTDFGLVLLWCIAIFVTCHLPNNGNVQVSFVLAGIQLLMLHGFILRAEVRKHRERQEAQLASVRLSKLEQDRMKQRQERVELCLGILLHHLKAPLLLMKSEVSVSVEPEEAVQTLAGVRSRIGQLWSIFTGLETRVLGEMGEDETFSPSLFAGLGAFMVPETIHINHRSQQQADDFSRRNSGDEDDLRSDGAAAAAAAVHEDTFEQQAPPARRPSLLVAEPQNNSAPPMPDGTAVSCPYTVRVTFDPLDTKLAVHSVSFLMTGHPDEDLFGLLSLFPQCRGDFQLWLQSQVNSSINSLSEGDVPCDNTPFGRVALALPILRLMLQKLVLHPGALGDVSLTFAGLEDPNGDLAESLADTEGGVRAVVELSDVFLRSSG